VLITPIVFESGGMPVASMLLLVALIATPLVFVFLRFGLLTVTAGMLLNLLLGQLPMTANLARPHATASTWALLVLIAIAAAAFHVSRAGRGMFKGVMVD
jgi:hypothetical protein